jgi:hypothetical protein
VSSVAVGAGGRFVATGGSASVALWEGDLMQPVVQVVGLGPVYRVALTADGRFAWCAGDDRLSFVELATGRFGAAPLQGTTGLIKMSYVVALLVDGIQRPRRVRVAARQGAPGPARRRDRSGLSQALS